MPKRVDHELRKRQIAKALLDVAGKGGLHAVGVREVAAQAGMSVRLIQYYFETKERLLFFGLEYLGEIFRNRVRDRLALGGRQPTPEETMWAILDAAFPSDDESRSLHATYTAYSVLALTDSKLAEQPFLSAPNALEASLITLLRAALAKFEIPDDEIRWEVVGLLAMSAGLGTSILAGQRDVEAARSILRHHLGRILRGPVDSSHHAMM